MSKILRGERPASPELIEKMGQRLSLAPANIEKFKAYELERRAGVKALPLSAERRKYFQLSSDTFEVVSDWRHFTILELMKFEGFVPDPQWISRVANIGPAVVRACVERLIRVGILEIAADGKWRDKSDGFSTHILGENYTTSAHQKSQGEILGLALEALKAVPIERRDQSSMMMATDAKRITEAKKRITAFRRELCEFLEAAPKKTAVYQLSVSLFPLVEDSK